ncbi:component of the polarisome [Fusarium falciforme]|nr:component of the polarisome [Fusarium falciforme]
MNYAAGAGLYPLSLLDAAASRVAGAVVDLLRLVKVQTTPAEDLEDDDGTVNPVESSSALPACYNSFRSPTEPYSRNKSMPEASTAPNGVVLEHSGGNENVINRRGPRQLDVLAVGYVKVSRLDMVYA